MTIEEKKIKVAEKCGLTCLHCGNTGIKTEASFSDPEKRVESKCSHRYLPDYPNDLNSCHEMEKVLSPMECIRYEEQLIKAANCNYGKGVAGSLGYKWGIGSAQRFDAFGITCGLWKEEE